MIPRIIHYCWLSDDPYPKEILKCLQSWKIMLPDYEIWLWDQKRFDITSSSWVSEAFGAKKYAFCADYIRLYALFNFGGIYLDSDVEVVRPLDNLLHLPYFIGYESKQYYEAAVIGAEKGNAFIGKVLQHYENRHFVSPSGTQDKKILPIVMMEETDGWKKKTATSIEEFDYAPDVISVFPFDWFSPIDTTGKKPQLKLSKNTYTIHHFTNSWVGWKTKLLIRVFGNNSPIAEFIVKYGKAILGAK